MIGPGAGFARSQTTAEEEKLELEFTQPLTTLPQIFLKDAYSPANFGTDGPSERSTLSTNEGAPYERRD